MGRITFPVLALLILGPLTILSFVPSARSGSFSTFRGRNYALETYDNGTRRWISEPEAVWNGSHWVDFIFIRDDAKKCYRVKTGLLSGEIYDTGVGVFYDVNMTEERVKSEVWELWDVSVAPAKKATLTSPITFTVTQNSSGVYINATRTSTKPNGIFTVLYHFRVGLPLKHYVYWKSQVPESKVSIKQVWDLAGFITKCTVDGVEKTSGFHSGREFLFTTKRTHSWFFKTRHRCFTN